MDNPVNKNLLFDHFAGRDTAIQRRLIEVWLREPGNSERYYEWLEEWENQHPQYVVDVNARLEHTLNQLHTPKPVEDEPVQRPIRRLPVWSRWAAVLAGLLMLSALYNYKTYILYRSEITEVGERRSVVLPEGSRVTLGSNSQLRYARFGFGSRTRQVFLNGEAFFSVRHLPDHTPFVVNTNRPLSIYVRGTEFNVLARPQAMRVMLRRGKVDLIQTDQQRSRRLRMVPGDLVNLDNRGRLSRQRLAPPDLETGWQERTFTFDHTSLEDIGQMLEANYGLRVIIADASLRKRTISGTFSTSSAAELGQVVADLLKINLVQTTGHLTFTEAARH